jgi:hypothetical protein
MSATAIASLLEDSDARPESRPRRAKWWGRLLRHCAGVDCPHRGKLWPAWLRKAPGVDFEGRWYCEIGCLKPLLAFRVHTLLSSFLLERPRTHRVPIGLLLVNRGAISQEQLRDALRLQREAGRDRIGDWLLQMGAVTEHQLTAALGQQWGCPTFPLERQTAQLAWSDLLPLPLLEAACAVPAYASPDGRLLHLAFGERLDHTTLYAIEQMLGCRTLSSVAVASAVARVLDDLRRHAAKEETCFDTIRDPQEMTWIICSYADELKAAKISLARASGFIWVRFHRRKSARDLLFRISPAATPTFFEKSPGRAKGFAVSADTGKDGVSDACTSL